MLQPDRPIRVWCLAGDQQGHVKPVEEAFGAGAEFIYPPKADPADLERLRPDILVCVNDWPYDISQCIDAARRSGIPSIVLQDGILEWRCQYENPLFGAGGGAPQHQPVLADKIACIGPQSARDIGLWGNEKKIEVTGMPRLDPLILAHGRGASIPGFRVLVLTAKNPGFTMSQREVTARSLFDLKKHLEMFSWIHVTWRIGASQADAIGVRSSLSQIGGSELPDQIREADAVISTMSTAILEAMLLGRPVALLDYHNGPRFINTAWTIACQEHMNHVVPEILTPPLAKMEFQEHCLFDVLRYDGPSAPRVKTLMVEMITIAERARADNHSPLYPQSMVEGVRLQQQSVAYTLDKLYPGQDVFKDTSIEALQARLARLQKENERLKLTVSERSLRNIVHSLKRRIASLVG